jgi:hypothetical protein
MSDYDAFFKQQMIEWAKNPVGPAPVHDSTMGQFRIPNKKFVLEQAIADMARKDPTLLMWIYENWALQQNQKQYFPKEKSELL